MMRMNNLLSLITRRAGMIFLLKAAAKFEHPLIVNRQDGNKNRIDIMYDLMMYNGGFGLSSSRYSIFPAACGALLPRYASIRSNRRWETWSLEEWSSVLGGDDYKLQAYKDTVQQHNT